MKGLLPYTINVKGQLIDLSEPQVMGILNVTPDSFFSGSRKQTETEILTSVSHIGVTVCADTPNAVNAIKAKNVFFIEYMC